VFWHLSAWQDLRFRMVRIPQRLGSPRLGNQKLWCGFCVFERQSIPSYKAHRFKDYGKLTESDAPFRGCGVQHAENLYLGVT
jgi:hypothetical protein